MCYKNDKYEKIELDLNEKMKDIPVFIRDFFTGYKSAITKLHNWTVIRDTMNWLIEQGYIKKNSINDITESDLNQLKHASIQKYLSDLQNGLVIRNGKKVKKNTLDTINTKKNVLSAFWNYLRNNKYVDDNIIRLIPSKLFKSEVTIKEVKVPTDAHLQEFLDNLANAKTEFTALRNRTIVDLILGSGIRLAELVNLDIKDVYINNTRPYINVLGKGKIEQYDKVRINTKAVNSLKKYIKERDKYIVENNLDTNALFVTENGRMSSNSIAKFFDSYSGNKITPHKLRHWVGTKLYEKTKDIIVVQKQLRHASLETAAKYYVKLDDDKLDQAMEML